MQMPFAMLCDIVDSIFAAEKDFHVQVFSWFNGDKDIEIHPFFRFGLVSIRASAGMRKVTGEFVFK